MRTKVLVAGIGNLFFSDDGFGPAVVAAMLSPGGDDVPDGVRVVDYGIRGMHLAYDLLDDVEALVLVDAIPAGAGDREDGGEQEPGSITVLEVGPDDLGQAELDAHGMQPVSVLAGLESMGGRLPPTYVVGCVPLDVSEGMGLSAPVTAAVDEAAAVVTELVRELVDGLFIAVPAGVEGAAPARTGD